MKKSHVLLAVMSILIALPATVSADYYQSYEMNVDIGEQTGHEINALYVEEGNDTDSIEIMIESEPENLIITVNGNQVPVQAEDTENGFITDVPIVPGQANEIEVAYTTEDPSADSSQGTLYRKAFKKPVEVRRYTLSVTLPPGATIVLDNDVPIISPDASLTTDGQRITLEWDSFLRENQAHTAVVVYDTGEGSNTPLIAGVLAGLVAVYGLVRYKPWKRQPSKRGEQRATDRKASKKQSDDEMEKEKVHIDTILDTLTDNEKKILDVILRFKGKAMQKDVVRELDFSKSKVSKVLRGLEMKGIVEKKPYGRTNILRIADKYTWDTD